MRELSCAVCHSNKYQVRYPDRLPATESLNFSARRAPEKYHARIVECSGCGLVYSNPYFDEDVLRPLYREAVYIDEQQLNNMSTDYLREFTKAAGRNGGPLRILEIGCANGFFLGKLAQAGYRDVYGVEPGKDAVGKTVPTLHGRIINDFFRPGLFSPTSFDVVCCFQIFDHIPDPNQFLQDIRQVLRPGGILLAINHNIRAFITKVLGEKSPMYDIEHICLFDKKTIRLLFEANGFEVTHTSNLKNSYTVAYAAKMFPLPAWIKSRMVRILEGGPFSHMNLRLAAGNMVTVGRKRD